MLAKRLVVLSVGLLVFGATGSQASDTCMRATRALPAGAVPSAEDLVLADCGDATAASAVRYDANMRAVRLSRDVAPGDIVASVPSDMMAAVSPGQTLYVTVQVGPVLVQREVVALQPANPGQKLFVRTADGDVLSVLYSGATR